MINQLRIYEIFPDTRDAFHERFCNHAARIMEDKYGFRISAMWETGTSEAPKFAYLLAWKDEDEMKGGWADFMADEEWAGIKEQTAGSKMVGEIEEFVLHPTYYSIAIGATG
ncbi:MAG: NIPSNAP family protein [Pseudomonadota bacterium]